MGKKYKICYVKKSNYWKVVLSSRLSWIQVVKASIFSDYLTQKRKFGLADLRQTKEAR